MTTLTLPYDRAAAVAYAHRWAYGRNPKFYDYDEIGGDWHVSDEAFETLVALCTDICRRSGMEALTYTGDADGSLTIHKMFHDTDCPGPYLESRMDDLANQVNLRLALP